MRSSILRRRASLGTAAAALGVGLSTLSAHPAVAQTTVYTDTASSLGYGDTNGSLTSGSGLSSGSTFMLADDVTPVAGSSGLAVTQFSFSVANFNAASVAFAPTVYFYGADGTGGGPGTLLAGFTFNPFTVGSGAGGLVNYSPTTGATLFNLPSTPSATIWAGVSFSSTTATQDQLNNIGQLLYGTPTVGSSTNLCFQSTAIANPSVTTNNPAGSFFTYGAPVANANYGWSIRTATPPVPEASTTVSLGLMLALGMGGLAVASKRKKGSVKA